VAKKNEPVFRWDEEDLGSPLASQYFPQIRPVVNGQMPLSAAVHFEVQQQ
jgi:hypothetical protein